MSERVYRALIERMGEANPEPRLEPTARLVDLLGNPQQSAPVIHITGTNGKTSTARMIAALLRAVGLRTGLLTSPHLDKFTERIEIDGDPIDVVTLEQQWDEIRPYVEMVDRELVANGTVPLTFFETLTALAFACFADAPVDVLIIEVGMGGSWDSTNVSNADVAVFTPIDLDHLGRIGNSLEEIATTKAGIIKPNSIVVSAAQQSSVTSILSSVAETQGSTMFVSPSDFELLGRRTAVGGQLIDIRGVAHTYPDVFLSLFGSHQAENAAVAIAAVEAFLGGGSAPLSLEVIEAGLGTVTSPGRLEIVGTNPTCIVDGAHNPHGARALVSSVGEVFAFTAVAVVVGVLSDKDAVGVLMALSELDGPIFVTQSDSERALSASDFADLASSLSIEVHQCADLRDAADQARAWAAAGDGRGVVATGSITVAGAIRSHARQMGWMQS